MAGLSRTLARACNFARSLEAWNRKRHSSYRVAPKLKWKERERERKGERGRRKKEEEGTLAATSVQDFFFQGGEIIIADKPE